MGRWANIQIGMISIAIYAIILHNINTNDKKLNHHEHFKNLILSLLVASFMDAMSWIVNGSKFPFSPALNMAVNSIYTFFAFYPSYNWYQYAQNVLGLKENKTNRMLGKALHISLYIMVLLICINIFYPLLFEIDSEMNYKRREFFAIVFAFSNLFLFIPTFIGILKLKTLKTLYQKRECKLIILFATLPICASIIQYFTYGYSLVWPTIALSVLSVFINNKNKYLDIDELTGLYNKDQFDLYSEEKRFTMRKDKHLAIILINVHNFRNLNTMYGYIEGDRILVRVARILRITTKQIDSFCARLKGDNFCIILEVDDASDLFDLIDNIKLREKYYQSKYHSAYQLNLNIGYSISEKSWPINLSDLLSIANREMYIDKCSKLESMAS